MGSLLVVAALYNHYLGHSAYLIEILFIASGCGLALYSLLGIGTGPQRVPAREGLFMSFLCRFMSKRHIALFLPLAGFLIILAWSGWKLLFLGDSLLRMEDIIVTLFGLSLVLYDQGPSKYIMQKDFAVLYLLFMTLVFAVIWKAYVQLTGDSLVRLTGYSEYYLITVPVSSAVGAMGVPVWTELDLSGHGLSNIISYEYHGRILRLGIGTGCSGLYSAGLFFSAFLAFVLVRYARVDLRVVLALALGLIVTWASNIIRMVATVLVGHRFGHPALVVFHSYIGVIMFVAVAFVFWYFILRWLDRAEPAEKTVEAISGT